MIRNLNVVLAPLLDLKKNVKIASQRAELTIANRIVDQAIADAPGSLGSKITVTQTEDSTIIYGGDEISAYVEFGTGSAQVTENLIKFGNDPDMAKEALKFFVNGEGRLAAHPFFFPAIFDNEAELLPEIEKELNNADQS